MTPLQWVLGAAAFAVEVALVVVTGVVAYRLVRPHGAALAWTAAVVALLALGTVWALWVSPNADHRLPTWPRVAVACGLLAATAASLGATGSSRAAWAYGVLGCLAMVVAQPALDQVP